MMVQAPSDMSFGRVATVDALSNIKAMSLAKAGVVGIVSCLCKERVRKIVIL